MTQTTKHCAGYPAWGQPPHDDVPLSRFNARPSRPDGLERLCKDCAKAGRAAKAGKVQEETIDARDLRIMAEEAFAEATPAKAPRKRTPTKRVKVQKDPIPEVATVA